MREGEAGVFLRKTCEPPAVVNIVHRGRHSAVSGRIVVLDVAEKQLAISVLKDRLYSSLAIPQDFEILAI